MRLRARLTRPSPRGAGRLDRNRWKPWNSRLDSVRAGSTKIGGGRAVRQVGGDCDGSRDCMVELRGSSTRRSRSLVNQWLRRPLMSPCVPPACVTNVVRPRILPCESASSRYRGCSGEINPQLRRRDSPIPGDGPALPSGWVPAITGHEWSYDHGPYVSHPARVRRPSSPRRSRWNRFWRSPPI